MKDLKSFLTESKTSYTVKGRTLEFTIDHNLSIPVMVASATGRQWGLQYIQALPEKDGSYGLYLQTMVGDGDKSEPVDGTLGTIIPVNMFDFVVPRDSQRYDITDSILELGPKFTENQVVTVKF